MTPEIKQRITQLNNGEVPSGYEKTDFGIFPCDWVTDKKLKDLGSFGKGKGLPGDKMTTEGVPCVGYGDIYMKYNHFHFEEAQTFVDEETASESQPIQKGTLLFTGTGETADEIGKCVCYNGDETIYAGGDIITFVSNKVNPLFLAYQQYQEFSLRKKASYGQGHSVVHIQRENLEKLNVAYPKSTEEQSKIAEILMKWDESIELYKALINEMDKKRAFIIRQIVSKKAAWKVYSFFDILEERIEYSKVNNQHEVLSSTKQGLFAQNEYFDKQVASENNIGYKVIREGDLVLSPQNLWLGNINYNNSFEIGIVSPSYKVFKIKDGFDKTLVSTIMKLPIMLHKYVLSSEQGASVVRRNLNMDLFYQITISLPDSEEQQKLGNVIAMINKQILLYQKQYDVLIHQRKTLQQYLLNGIVRV